MLCSLQVPFLLHMEVAFVLQSAIAHVLLIVPCLLLLLCHFSGLADYALLPSFALPFLRSC